MRAQEGSIQMARARILVIDDEPDIREMLRAYLEACDYEVDVAETAVTGLAAAMDRRPGVVLLDLVMPGIPGQDVVAALSTYAPVIIITGVANIEIARQTLRAGAFDFIMKPFDPERVAEVVETALLHGKR
jgi:DNA-binding NtrC family response regulator